MFNDLFKTLKNLNNLGLRSYSSKIIDLIKTASEEECPPATQDLDLNLKNRNIAFQKYDYGPSDPRLDFKESVDVSDIKYDKPMLYSDEENDVFLDKEDLRKSPNYSFWERLMGIYNMDDERAVLNQRCGNCAAFVITSKMKECIESAIDEADAANTAMAGELGYCQFLKFKCAAARTCQSWVGGGPIKDE